MTLDELKKIVRPNLADKYYQPLVDTMKKYSINTPLRIQHFLAQVLHESGGFRYKEEIADGSAYEGRRDLGNTQVGDGKTFKGRGLIQLTGRANYESFKKDSGIDVVKNPELVANDPNLSALVAGWFWNKKNLNRYADKDDINTITKIINGGFNGLNDRKNYLQKAKSIISGLFDTTQKTIQRNPMITVLITTVVILGVFTLYKTLKA